MEKGQVSNEDLDHLLREDPNSATEQLLLIKQFINENSFEAASLSVLRLSELLVHQHLLKRRSWRFADYPEKESYVYLYFYLSKLGALTYMPLGLVSPSYNRSAGFFFELCIEVYKIFFKPDSRRFSRLWLFQFLFTDGLLLCNVAKLP